MYLNDRCSKRAIMMNIPTTQIAASSPAAMPHCQVVPGAPRKKARLYDRIHAIKNDKPKFLIGFAFASCSSVSPFSACQGFAKRSGDHQNAPMTKLITAQTNTAM